jgi:hypothetical protein
MLKPRLVLPPSSAFRESPGPRGSYRFASHAAGPASGGRPAHEHPGGEPTPSCSPVDPAIARYRASFGASQSGTGTSRWPRLGAVGAGISSRRERRIERSDPSASMPSSNASRLSFPSVASRGKSINSTRIRPSLPAVNLAGYSKADIVRFHVVNVDLPDAGSKRGTPYWSVSNKALGSSDCRTMLASVPRRTGS